MSDGTETFGQAHSEVCVPVGAVAVVDVVDELSVGLGLTMVLGGIEHDAGYTSTVVP